MIDVTKCRHCDRPAHHPDHGTGREGHAFEPQRWEPKLNEADIAVLELIVLTTIIIGLGVVAFT